MKSRSWIRNGSPVWFERISRAAAPGHAATAAWRGAAALNDDDDMKTFTERLETILISRAFWVTALALLAALPFLLVFIRGLEQQADFLALCRELLGGGR